MKINAFLFTAAAVLTGSAAIAGGYIAPVVETEAPLVVEEAAPAWAGAYVGGTLGYAFQGEDRYGLHDTSEDPAAFLGNIGTMKLSGVNGGVRAGYRWEKGSWVFGPELAFDFGSIKDDVGAPLTLSGGVAADMEGESKIKNVASLVMKGGYLVKPDLLLFTKAGVARADIDYKLSGVDEDGDTFGGSAGFKKTGYVVGFGLEKRVSEKLSVSGEYEYANFGKETRNFDNLETEATPKYNNIKVGVNYRF